MKKFLLIPVILIGWELVYSQNIISIGRSLRHFRTPTKITRQIRVPIANTHNAIEVAKLQSLQKQTHYTFTNTSTLSVITLERQLAKHTIQHPVTIVGPYNYVRVFSGLSKEADLVDPKFTEEWKYIQKAQDYNGAHHIINKYTLKLIWEEQRANGIKTNLSDMQKNAPAIFHPLHGNPAYKYHFHNPETQLEIYKEYGMKIVLVEQLRRIDEVNIANGFPTFPETYVQLLIKETRMWCKEHKLIWETSKSILDYTDDYQLPNNIKEPENLFK